MRSMSIVAPFGFSDFRFGHGQGKLPRIFVVIRKFVGRFVEMKGAKTLMVVEFVR